jgi:type I restriction enzyme S subunit
VSGYWLSQVPSGWHLLPLRRVTELQNIRVNGTSRDEGYIGLENIEPWTGRLLKSDVVYLEDDDEKSGVVASFDAGDVLFGKLRPYLAKAHLAQENGICTTELLVLKPQKQMDARFLLRIILTNEFINQVNTETFGARMPRADWNIIGNLLVPVPPIPQQRAIADYLDRETARIDALIAAKERLLELLAEKRRTVITHAVTRGLNPDVPMRDSGVEWLGEIPSKWNVVRIKNLIFGIDTGFSPNCYSYPASEGEWGVLKTGCVNWGVFNPEENKTLPEVIAPPLNLEVKIGDILMSRASGSLDLIGSVALVHTLPKARLLLSDKTFRIKLNLNI